MDIFEKIRQTLPLGEDWEEFEKILKLPDDKFNAVYPIYKEKFQKFFETPNFQKECLSQIGTVPIEDMEAERASFEEFLSDIANDTSISKNKREFLIYFFRSIIGNLYNMAENPRERIKISIEKITPTAKIPEYANPSDAGCDIYSNETITIKPGETKIVKTGIKIAIPAGYGIFIYPRSGMSAKTKIRVANSVGIIDSTYHKEIGVILDNIGTEDYTINIGDRIAQMIIQPVPMINWVEDLIEDTARGGFGSTGN